MNRNPMKSDFSIQSYLSGIELLSKQHEYVIRKQEQIDSAMEYIKLSKKLLCRNRRAFH